MKKQTERLAVFAFAALIPWTSYASIENCSSAGEEISAAVITISSKAEDLTTCPSKIKWTISNESNSKTYKILNISRVESSHMGETCIYFDHEDPENPLVCY